MTEFGPIELPPEYGHTHSPITLLYVDDDPQWLELVRTGLNRYDRFDVRTETSSENVLEHLEEIDCLVSDFSMPELNGLELLKVIRERSKSLPFILFTSHSLPTVSDELLAEDWTDYLRKAGNGATMDLLARRICQFAEHNRISRIAVRGLAAVELVRDGIAIVSPDGAFEYVNQVYANQFDYDPVDLIDRSWTTTFTEESIQRIEETAVPNLANDWQWSGSCIGRRKWGETVTIQLCIAGIEDGSMLLAIRGGTDAFV